MCIKPAGASTDNLCVFVVFLTQLAASFPLLAEYATAPNGARGRGRGRGGARGRGGRRVNTVGKEKEKPRG